MTRTASKPRQSKQDALYATPLQIGLSPTVWRAIHAAVLKARDKSMADLHLKCIPAALEKIGSVLKAHDAHKCSGGVKPSYDAGEPNLYVESTLWGWSLLADLIITFGDELANCPGGRTIVVACSQVIHGVGAAEVDDGD